MKTALIALAVVTVVAIPLSAAWAFGPGHRGGFDRIERMMDRLDLTDDQRSQVFAIIDGARPTLRNLRHEMHESHEAIREYVKNGNTDDAVLEEMANKQGDLVTAMTLTGGRMMRDVRNVLNEEQRENVGKMLEHRRGKHGKHGERHGKFGGHRHGHHGFFDGDDSYSPAS